MKSNTISKKFILSIGKSNHNSFFPNNKKYGVCAKIFRDTNFEGWEECVYPPTTAWNYDCLRLDNWWQDHGNDTARVSSVNTWENCVILWSREDCTGRVAIRSDLPLEFGSIED